MDNTIKKIIMEEIENKALLFDKRSDVQYRIRCPLCGDSSKNPRDMHCYIKCDYRNPDENIKYNCFLCNRGGESAGQLSKLLKALNADQSVLDLVNSSVANRIGSIKTSNIDIITNTPIMDSPQVEFLSNRLGQGFTYDDISRFRIIWNMSDIRKYITDTRKLNTLPNNTNRINFITDNKSMILSRSFLEDEKESQWRKIQLFQNTKSFYLIQATVDLFTSDNIIINIAEGVLDILSAYKNFDRGPNSVYIASLGSNYISALQYLMMKGFVGKNIDVIIYIDQGIDHRSLLNGLKKYRWLFGKIKVYQNIKYKDIGTKMDKIKLMEVK